MFGLFTISRTECEETLLPDDAFTRQKGERKTWLRNVSISLAVFALLAFIVAQINFTDEKMRDLNTVQEIQGYEEGILNLHESMNSG